jgi:hypothetical protein
MGAEIVASLRCSEAAARSRVHQALRALRDHFAVTAQTMRSSISQRWSTVCQATRRTK